MRSLNIKMIFVLAIIFAHVFLTSCHACPEPVTTLHIQNHDGPIYVTPSDHIDNKITIGNRGNRLPTDCSGNHLLPDCSSNRGHQTPLYHSCPHASSCDSDCKCLTKQLSTCVPINTVPQITCTPYYGYPDYSYGYAYYPECYSCNCNQSYSKY